MLHRIIDIYKDSFSGLSRSVWLLSLIMLINRAGAMVLPFMSLYLTTDLGFSLTAAGWVMGAYGLGSISGAYLGGYLTDKFGYYHIQLYSLLFSSIILLLLVFLTDYMAILISVFCFSLITDTLRPANSVAIAAYSTPENRTRSFSLMRFAINLGFSIGPAMGGIVAGTLGFRWIFLIDAITCLMAAYILFRYLPFNKASVPEKKTKTTTVGLSAYKDKDYLLFIFLVSLYAIAFFQLFTSVPVYWEREWVFSESKIGFLLALNGLIIVILEMPFIRSLEHIQRHMVMISFGCVLLIVSFIALIAGWMSTIPALIFIVLMSFSEMFAMPFMTNYAVSRPTEDRRGQYMALYAMAYGVAHIVAPMGSMLVADHFSFYTLYLILAGLSLIVAVSFYSLRMKMVRQVVL
ncbi:MAG: MFS transporter [Saprospiraceae bacterium]|nr:MFS transporter [Saprospiraceae bacterium]